MDESDMLMQSLDELDRIKAVYAARYAWEREHPVWESEAYLAGMTPEEYDIAIDKARRGAANGNA